MVVGDLNVVGIAFNEVEADTPLVVYRDRVLPSPVALQSVQAITGRNAQIIQITSQVEVFQPTQGSANQIRRKPATLADTIQISRMMIREGLDHNGNCTASRDGRQVHHACEAYGRQKMDR